MTPPVITVGIIHSRDEFYDDCIGSIRTFVKYPHIKVVVIDNHDNHLTVGAAHNELVRRAPSDYILFLGDDDMLLPECVSMMAEAIDTHRLMQVSCWTTAIDENNNIIGYLQTAPAGIWHKRIIEEAGWFDEKRKMQIDFEFAQRVRESGIIDKFHIIPKYRYAYRLHDGCISGKRNLALLLKQRCAEGKVGIYRVTPKLKDGILVPERLYDFVHNETLILDPDAIDKFTAVHAADDYEVRYIA